MVGRGRSGAPGVSSLATQLWATGAGTFPDPGGFCGVRRAPGNHTLQTAQTAPCLSAGSLGPWPEQAGQRSLAWKWGQDRVSARQLDGPGKNPVSAEPVPREPAELGSPGQSRPWGAGAANRTPTAWWQEGQVRSWAAWPHFYS